MVYLKLNQYDCALPERKICNYSRNEKTQRCPYMKYIKLESRWECKYKKDKSICVCRKCGKKVKEGYIGWCQECTYPGLNEVSHN